MKSHRPYYHGVATKSIKKAISKLNHRVGSNTSKNFSTLPKGGKPTDPEQKQMSIGKTMTTSHEVKEKLKNTILSRATPLPGDLCNLTMDDIMNTTFMQEHFSDCDLDEIVSTYIPEGDSLNEPGMEPPKSKKIAVSILHKDLRQNCVNLSNTPASKTPPTKLPISKLHKTSYKLNKLKWDNYIPKNKRGIKTNIYSPHNIHGTKIPASKNQKTTTSSASNINPQNVRTNHTIANTPDKAIVHVQPTMVPTCLQPNRTLVQVSQSTATNNLQPSIINNVVGSMQIPFNH